MRLSKLKHSTILVGLFVFTFFVQMAYGHGMSEAEKQIIADGGNLQFLWIGATHMITGYDHLMFVFGIIFFLTSFRDIVKYVTAFTLGHSVTLIIGTYNGIQINYYLIDAVIALSVCYIAFQNLDGFRKYFQINAPNMMAMIFSLGLIHGFGLSTRLQALPLNQDDLFFNIVSFNVGVELGQITALAGMLLLIPLWRKMPSFSAHSRIANYGLIMAGILLFLVQMHDYSHDGQPEELVANTGLAQKLVVSEATASTGNQQKQKRSDSIQINISAFNGKEYKFMLEKGGTLEYSWETDGKELYFDFHGEPKGDTTGYFKSFKISTDSKSSGSFTAPFAGTIGWYWENKTPVPVNITLHSSGIYEVLNEKKDLNELLTKTEKSKKRNSIF